jgi:deoxyribonuclease-4
MITFATAGKPNSFKGRYPFDLPDYLAEFGLNGFEVQCGRGINISEDTYKFFAEQNRIKLSLHSPYYISISSVDEAVREKSVNTILESARAADRLGARRIIVHSGSCAKISREQAMEFAADSLKKARNLLDSHSLEHIIICPETMGKINQLGTLEEVLELCRFDERMIPCIDFGHLNARYQGVINYREIFNKAGKYNNLHIHFSKIEYTSGGEKKHLTFADRQYGPDYKPLFDEIAARKQQNPAFGSGMFVVCESDGTQAEDCAEMALYWRNHE